MWALRGLFIWTRLLKTYTLCNNEIWTISHRSLQIPKPKVPQKEKGHVGALKFTGLSLSIFVIQAEKFHRSTKIKFTSGVTITTHVVFTDFGVKLQNIILGAQTVQQMKEDNKRKAMSPTYR